MTLAGSSSTTCGRGAVLACVLVGAFLLSGCATTAPHHEQVAAPISNEQAAIAQRAAEAPATRVLKRKIAIGRFTNETLYGRTFLVDSNLDPLGKQAADMLATGLVQSQKFLVFERPDINVIKKEQVGLTGRNLVGVDTLILGSITQFGRSTTGKSGFLSATKVQTARAKVEFRLVDVRTGYVFYTATGTGEASTESGEVAGFGSKAAYDGTLNDRAIGAAISDVLSTVISSLQNRPWRTDILKVDGSEIYISGGSHQGLKAGDHLSVLRAGQTIRSAQTGFDITLPPKKVGEIEIVGFFGDDDTNEGSIAKVLSGQVTEDDRQTLYIGEDPGVSP
jgi:curli biogenesis system outer membrane secretion channel CsgG